MNVRNRLAKGAMWVTGARGFVTIVGFASTIILARLLTPADYGLVAIATGILAILEAATSLSLASALIQLDEPTDEHLHTAWTLNLLRACAVASIMMIAAYPAASLYEDPRLAWVMMALAATSLINGLRNPRVALLAKQLVFWQEFVLSAGAKTAGFLAAVAVAYVYRSYWALVAGWAAAQLLSVLISYMITSYKPRVSFARVKDLWSFTMWLTFCEILSTLNWRMDQLLVGAALNTKAVGFYTVGSDLAAMPTREATAPLTQTLFPGLVAVATSKPRLRDAVRSIQGLVFAAVVPLGFGLALLAEPIVLLMLGPKWAPATFIIQAMACLYAVQTISIVAQPLAMAMGATKSLFKRDLLIFATRMPLIVTGLLMGGLQGIIIARVLAGMINIAINALFVKKLIDIGVREQFAVTARSLLSLATMSLALLIALHESPIIGSNIGQILKLFIYVSAGGCIYYGTHVLLWFASGRPTGPESQIKDMISAFLQRRNRKPASI